MDAEEHEPLEQPELEAALVAAQEDRTMHGAFLRALLEAQLLVVGEPMPDGDLRYGLAATEDGHEFVPVFTSDRALTEARPDSPDHVHVNARAFLEAVRDRDVVVNPEAPPTLALPVPTVANILEFGWEGWDWVREENQEATLSLPDDEPTAMFAAMATVLVRHPDVAAAYFGLAALDVDGPDAPPTALIGVDAGGELDIGDILIDLGPVAGLGGHGQTIFVPLLPSDATNQASVQGWLFQKGIRFYERA
jgi:hypothetical protein